MEKNSELLHFRFDISTFRLLGRELITDRITALFELVKNAYDANSQNVNIIFDHVNPLNVQSLIVIEDDGIGMSYEDIRDKWMVIGTSSKRRRRTSPPPYNRIVAGKKGVGRFAVDKLGGKLILKSKQYGSEVWHCLETDWTKYVEEEERQLTINFDDTEESPMMFTDLGNRYWTEFGNLEDHGTRLEISCLEDVWTELDVTRAYKELSKIIRPDIDVKYPFNITVSAPLYNAFQNRRVESILMSKATLSYSLKYRYDKSQGLYYQEYMETVGSKIVIKEKPAYSFGPICFVVNFYDKDAKKNISKDDKADGIKIYRDGVIATPFAEYKSSRDEQKDLFGIDKRRWSGFFERLSTRDLMGWVDITDELNPNIKDSTNRQDFVDNQEWSALKEFVISQIHQIEVYLKHVKTIKKKESVERLHSATKDVTELKERINKVKGEAALLAPDVEVALNDISSKLGNIKSVLTGSSAELDKLDREKKQQENIMFSLVSLQTYAGQISHIIKTSLGRIKRSAEFVEKWISDLQKVERCKHYAGTIVKEMDSLSKAISFMLSYAKDDSTFESFSVKAVLDDLFNDKYALLFDNEKINAQYVIEQDVELVYNRKAFEDIFGNMIDNSVKALRNISNKCIKCSIFLDKDNLIIYFSDNGIGIKEDNKDNIFNVFYTTTADLGGAGLGLYIIKTRLEAINGTIAIDENEFLPTGATFKIVIPLKH